MNKRYTQYYYLTFYLCILLVLFNSISATKWRQDCAWQNPQTKLYYNLTQLIKTSDPYYSSAGPSSDYFYINICDIVTTKGCTEELTTPVCQFYDGSFYTSGNITTQKFLPLSFNTGFADGVTLQYSNGSECKRLVDSPPRTSIINIGCSPGAAVPSILTIFETVCNFTINIESKLGCGSSSPVTGLENPFAVDFGWVIIFSAIVVFGVYIFGGVLYKGMYKNAEGFEMIPNIEFWRSTPGLFKDGCKFFVQKITCNRYCSDYELI